jgi:EAL domain-containing protein (putative c-di-GMP-specific phosphodiesterase class I)
LARSLNMITVVEGIETETQLEMARAEECEEGQGYLFSRPVVAAEVPNLLRRRKMIAAAA